MRYVPLSLVSCSLFTGRRVTELTDANVEFGLIPKDHWYQPDWIDEEKASAARKDMEKNQVIYGGMHFAPSHGLD